MTTGELVDAAALLAASAAASSGGALCPDARAQWRSLQSVETVCLQWRLVLNGDEPRRLVGRHSVRADECVVGLEESPAGERRKPCDDDGRNRRPHAQRDDRRSEAIRVRASAIEEMLVAEMLLRVWSAAMTISDPALNPIGRRMLSHLLMHRKRLLMQLLGDESLAPLAPRLDSVRRATDRWTDVLLAPFHGRVDLDAFCFDFERSQEFTDAWRLREWRNPAQSEPLVVAALRAAIPARPVPCPVRRLAYRELLGVILGAIGQSSFDGLGRWKIWQRRRLDAGRPDHREFPRRNVF